MHTLKLLVLGWILACLATHSLAQPGASAPAIQVVRSDGTQVPLSEGQLGSLPRSRFTATARDKTNAYEGSDLLQVLRLAGENVPEKLGGRLLRRVVTVHAVDGYAVAFSMAELDAAFGKPAFLVNVQNGQPLPSGEGPWRIVIPAERLPTRWVRQAAKIVVSEAP